MAFFFVICPLLLVSIIGNSEADQHCNSTACCYPELGLGCFTTSPPFDDLPLPEDPQKIAPIYWLYRLDQINNTVIFNSTLNASDIDVDHLIVLTHGFNGNMHNTPWHDLIIEELLKNTPKTNVLYVDWSLGADKYITFSGYKQAASNTRIIAAMTANFLKANARFDAGKTYCLGFSLGSHICGFMAKFGRFKWQRLTALDPAKPHFSKDDPTARVDKSDAVFVDAVHTSSTEGMQFPIGHVDLWVNNAKHQPGCSRFFRVLSRRALRKIGNRKLEIELTDRHSPDHVDSIIDRIEDYVGCSHGRAATLFYLSINLPTKCNFTPFCPCSYSEKNGVNMTDSCLPEQQQHFGYHIVTTRFGSFCGNTTDKPPYYNCEGLKPKNKFLRIKKYFKKPYFVL